MPAVKCIHRTPSSAPTSKFIITYAHLMASHPTPPFTYPWFHGYIYIKNPVLPNLSMMGCSVGSPFSFLGSSSLGVSRVCSVSRVVLIESETGSRALEGGEPKYGFNQTSLVCLSRQSLNSPSVSSTPTPSRLSSTSFPFSPFSSPSSLDFYRLSVTSPYASPLFLLPPKFEP